MAPHSNAISQGWKRQDNTTTAATPTDDDSSSAPSAPPSCVITCMASGDTTGCANLMDLACLCKSQAYAQSVASCWSQACTPSDMLIGQQYSASACLSAGVDVSNSSNSTATAPMPTISVDTTTPPQVYNKEWNNIQAIMSSICGALLLVAVGLGVMSVRRRLKREFAQSQAGSWTGLGSGTAHDKKPTATDFAYTRNASNAFASKTITDDNDNTFGINTIMSVTPPRRVERGFGASRGFTNRLTLVETPVQEEEWEMEKTPPKVAATTVVGDTGSSSSSSGHGSGIGSGNDTTELLNPRKLEDDEVVIIRGAGNNNLKRESTRKSARSIRSSTSSSDSKHSVILEKQPTLPGEIIQQSPITPSTIAASIHDHDRDHGHDDGNGSTVHLNRLDKGDGPKF